jgi:hypothetical protein
MEHVDRFITLLFAGAGMLLAGGINLLMPVRHVWLRTGVTLGIAGLAIGSAVVWTEKVGIAVWVAVLMSVGLIPCLMGGQWFRFISRFLGLLVDRMVIRWGLLAAIGVLFIAGSMILYQVEDETWSRRETDAILSTTYLSNHVESPVVKALTDRGNPITVTQCKSPRDEREVNENARLLLLSSGHMDSVIQRQPAGELCNCHGWVFTGGLYGVIGDQVDKILTDNGYQPIPEPRPGDLVIYRFPDGRTSHTALVRFVTPDMPVVVEGKWGWMGVYLHEVDRSIYGKNYTFYRSNRPGHLLRFTDLRPSTTHP